MTGMREQEVMHTTWPDLNLTRGVVTVRYKHEYGFSPKEQRPRDSHPEQACKALKKWKHNVEHEIDILGRTRAIHHKLHCLRASDYKLVGGWPQRLQEFQYVGFLWLWDHAALHFD